MRQRSRYVLIGAILASLTVIALMGSGARSSEAAVTEFTVHLSGANEVPPVDSPGFAIATFKLDDVSGMLDYSLSVQGIAESLVTAAHIHRGAPGTNGPVIYPLATAPFTSISGSIKLTPQDLADFKAGNLYVNVHSVDHPNGFARAQLGTPESQVTAAILATIAAYNAKDVNGFVSHFTDKGLEAAFGEPTAAQAIEDIKQFIGEPPITPKIDSVQVNGSQATAVVELNFGTYIEGHRFTLINTQAGWKIDGDQMLALPTPAGFRTVELKLTEYEFIYDKSAVADGKFAFHITNVGGMEHEVDLVKLAPGMSLQQFLTLAMSGGPDEPPPAGVEDVAHAGPFAPGEQGSLTLGKPLAPGNYALLCFVPAPDGAPHAFHGMASEFTVGASGTISPPNTGDAGLSGGDAGSGLNPVLPAAATLILGAIAIGGIAAVRAR